MNKQVKKASKHAHKRENVLTDLDKRYLFGEISKREYILRGGRKDLGRIVGFW